ncbi:hypothetical protein BT96DRAFT_117775 [Gymnopus androsaceus JB14]|uniref:Uncharacterized protein n=1 Tax=Gymnopus androsaceus JB14 TaxID=1447944 RepID=A0A6A4HG51_9AGAR|nr:hypothetical protein BT96DRAFT_117775 [Gymnopus androsaceus JB14]
MDCTFGCQYSNCNLLDEITFRSRSLINNTRNSIMPSTRHYKPHWLINYVALLIFETIVAALTLWKVFTQQYFKIRVLLDLRDYSKLGVNILS